MFWIVHGHGRRGPRRPLRSIQGTFQHHVLTRSDNQGPTTSTVNAVGQRAAYQVYCSICRRYVSEDLHPRCHDSTNNRDRSVTNTPTTNTVITVSALVMAQQSQSRSQSNSASTSVTVTGNNNSTIVAAHITPANVPPSRNGTEGEDESIIYRRCYECNINVPYQVYVNQSCHGPCQFCRVNRRHISCMEVHPDRTSAGRISVRWCMWCRAYITLDMFCVWKYYETKKLIKAEVISTNVTLHHWRSKSVSTRCMSRTRVK